MKKNNLNEWLQSKTQDEAYVLGYFVNQVGLGKYDGNQIHWTSDVCIEYLMELRVFNRSFEIHAVFNKTELIAESYLDDTDTLIVNDRLSANELMKLIHESNANKIAYDDELFVLGTSVERDGTLVQQGRRIKLPDLPFEWNVKTNPVRLKVRNYITFDESNELPQAVVQNSRLVEFTLKEGYYGTE